MKISFCGIVSWFKVIVNKNLIKIILFIKSDIFLARFIFHYSILTITMQNISKHENHKVLKLGKSGDGNTSLRYIAWFSILTVYVNDPLCFGIIY